MPEVLAEALRTHRRTLVGWTIGVGAFLVVNIATYPAVRDQAAYDDLLEDLPDAVLAAFGIEKSLSLTSPPGYLISQVFGFVFPLLLVVLAVGLGSRSIAAEEEEGTLDLLLAQPVSRRRVATEKFAALLTVATAVAAASWVVMVATSPLVGLDAGLGDLAVATGASLLFGLVIGAVAFAVGAMTGRRAVAVATASGVAVAAFLIESLAELTDVFARVRFLSPWYFANGNIPMVHGLRLLDLAVLVGLVAAALAAAVVVFERRDLA